MEVLTDIPGAPNCRRWCGLLQCSKPMRRALRTGSLATSPQLQGVEMKRRDFNTALSSALVAWPLAARTQQPEPAQQSVNAKRIAVVHPLASTAIMNEKGDNPYFHSLFAELSRLGYVEGKNLIVERRSGEGRTERYAEVARELVGLKPDVMVINGARILTYFREMTTTIPIIAITGDPILFGIVSNVSRPEGNVTGFSADASTEIHGKYLEILKEIKPGLSKVGLLSPQLSW